MKKEMKIKKSIIIFGVVLTTILMVSSATAVQQVNSESLMDKIDKKEKENSGFLEQLGTLDEFNPVDADKNRVQGLMNKINSFLDSNDLRLSNYETSDLYNTLEFQNLLNKDDGLENEMSTLKDELNTIVDNYAGIWPDELLKETLFTEISDFFSNLMQSDEYTNFKDSIMEETIKPLANSLGNVYTAKNKVKLSNTNEVDENNDLEETSALGFVAEQILIGLCTIVFFVNWMVFGHEWGQATEKIIGIVLAALVTIPAICILISDVVTGCGQVAFEALIATFMIIVGAFAETLKQAIYAAGIFGAVLWGVVFVLNLYILPIEFFVVFVIMFFEYADFELGYVVSHLGELVSTILLQAAEHARDQYENLFGPIQLPKSNRLFSNIKLFISNLFSNFLEQMDFLRKIFSNYMTVR